MKRRYMRGFSLLELTLVLGVGSMVAFMKFQDMKNEQETLKAAAVGNQIKQVGDAVNRYISIRYDRLAASLNAAGTGSDPGPRTCSANGVCSITVQTLINEGLLPSTYNGVNAQKSSYRIVLARSGTTPNYVVNGVITTSLPWVEGGKTRYDLLGKAMQAAGIDSGMTKSKTVASGYQGAWSEQATNFANIDNTGLLVYRAGYDSAMYSVYLRRDGTLPMTGDLNMGGGDIVNSNNITAAGTVNGKNIISSGGTSVGENLSVNGTTSLKGATTVSGDFNANGTTTINGTTTVNAPLFVWNQIVASRIHSNGNIEGQSLNLTYGATMKSSLMVGRFDVADDKAGWIQASGDIKSVNGDLYGKKLHVGAVGVEGASCNGVNEGIGTYVRDNKGYLLNCVNKVWTLYTPPAVSGLYVKSDDKCSFPNRATGSCSCSAGLTDIVINTTSESICSGGQNTHCTYYYTYFHACG
ncbi:TPA: pilus assembly protein PilV [Klebsiella aerogenes]|nr:pilus assembly protein PilV [Klebsiella aerogenes]